MKNVLKRGLISILQQTVDALGPLPDGLDIAEVLASDDIHLVIRVGGCFDKCLQDGDYVALEMLIEETRTRTAPAAYLN